MSLKKDGRSGQYFDKSACSGGIRPGSKWPKNSGNKKQEHQVLALQYSKRGGYAKR
jgi:hypothetical protein